MIAAAMLDRLLHRSVVLQIEGETSAVAPTAPKPNASAPSHADSADALVSDFDRDNNQKGEHQSD